VQCNDLFSLFYLSFSSFTLEDLLWLKLMQASPDKDANSDGQQLYRATFCNYFSIGGVHLPSMFRQNTSSKALLHSFPSS
jgi:hypothetical protein